MNETEPTPETAPAPPPEPAPEPGTQWTLAEAAKLQGVARQSIYRMAGDGRLSVTVRPDGVRIVDKAELLRSFGRIGPPPRYPKAAETAPAPPMVQAETTATQEAAVLRAELAAIREGITLRDQLLVEAKERENRLMEQLGAVTRLLGRPETSETTSSDSANAMKTQARKGFWGSLFGKAK